MDTNELLTRIRDRDTDAFLDLTQTYGWKLYAYLNSKLKDPELTNQAFLETFSSFYNTLAAQEQADIVECLLYAYGDQVCHTLKRKEPVAEPPSASAAEAPRQRPAGPAFWIVGILLSVGILAALWVILGLLMDMGILPELDLGYHWFCENIGNWF